MMHRPRVPIGERCYRALLLLYPRAFRARFGAELLDFARARRAESRFRGTTGALRLAGFLLADLVGTAPAARWSAVRESRHARAEHRALRKRTHPRPKSIGERMNSLLQDFRFAVRSLGRRPGFTLVAALTLALGIGANSAIFSVVYAVLIRPLPYPEADRLVAVWGTAGSRGQQSIAYPDYFEWREQNRTLDDIGVYRAQSVNLTGVETPQRLIGTFASASFLRVLDATAERGRLFSDRETEIATKEPVAVVSHEAWQTHFGADPALVGKSISLNGTVFVVIGITPPGFTVPVFGIPDVYLPMPYYPNAGGLDRGSRSIWAIGRLKPGVARAAAQTDLAAIAHRQAELYPETNAGAGAEVQSLKEFVVGPTRAALYIVFAAVGVVLLIACANVANLQLARGTTRQRELSVRAALGAGRGRIVRQLLTESIALSLIGGAAGLALALGGTKWLATAGANILPPGFDIRMNPAVVLFALGLSLASGILFGIAPAWRASRAQLHDMLRTRSGAASGRGRTRNALVVAQLALSLTLLTCAGLLMRSLMKLQHVDTGFDATNLMTMQLRLPPTKYDTPEKIWAIFQQMIAEIRAVPGVESAALVRAFPLTGNGETMPLTVDGQPPAPAGQAPSVQLNTVTSAYFATMRIPRLAGRDISDVDRADSPPVVIVNTELAQRTWPGQSALGKRIQFGGDPRWWTVVGVVGAAKQFALNETPLLQAYIAHAQRPQIFTAIAVRTTDDPLHLANAVRDAIWRADRDQPVWGVRTMSQLLDSAVGSPRMIVDLMAGFAVVALLLAAIGIYGVLSYTMAQRTHEMGIRMALGAEGQRVVWMIVREGMALVGVAVALGTVASLGAARLLRAQLFGVGTSDPLTFIVVAALLSAVALAACYLPARRASRVDPTEAMRTE